MQGHTQIFQITKTYTEQNGVVLISIQLKMATIVMMGSSLTQKSEIGLNCLKRNDIVNRGIGSDIAEGYWHRIYSVHQAQNHNMFFLEIGANDLLRKTHR
jgi:hypothetical protein